MFAFKTSSASIQCRNVHSGESNKGNKARKRWGEKDLAHVATMTRSSGVGKAHRPRGLKKGHSSMDGREERGKADLPRNDL